MRGKGNMNIEELLTTIQKTNHDMTTEKLIAEVRYNDYLTKALIISKGIADKEEKCYYSK